MKKYLYITFLFVIMLGQYVPAWGQASTEGKDFWISSTLCVAPPPKNGSDNRVPADIYIAVSAKKATTVTITNPHINNWQIQQNIPADTWYEFKNIPQQNWYPQNIKNTGNILPLNDAISDLGLHLTSTEDISVYVVLRADASMDATNILPTTTLQSEYFAIDYWAEAHDNKADIISMITILATEDNTQVRITPSNNTYNNTHAANSPYTISLQKGQVYYMLSQHKGQLTGTHIEENHGKKIAVYCGSALTRVPNGISARDCLYEQVMPLDYWGTEFVVTRSVEKDANIFAIVGMEDNTDLTFDGEKHFTINRGETQYFELNHGQMKSYTDHVISTSNIFAQDAIYINSSCPVAVMSFDTGNSYTSKSGSEISNSLGDPSSVWISPLQQRINKITFGTCHTNKTKRHYLDVVCPTTSADQTILSSNQRATIALNFLPVPGNSGYSYARMLLVDDDNIANENVFTLSNPNGIVAHVYGNGNDESYAYSVGSAAVKRGVNIEGQNFTDGYTYEGHFCLGEELSFDAQVGSDIVDKVDWDFGDGITITNGSVQMGHTYVSPGWYDASATIYAHKECPETVYPGEKVTFSFYINRMDTIIRPAHLCLDPGDEKKSNDTTTYDCDSVVIYRYDYGYNSDTTYDYTAKDSIYLAGQWHYKDETVTWTIPNAMKCDSTITCNLTVVTCINIKAGQPEFDCSNADVLTIPYTLSRGHLGEEDAVAIIGTDTFPLFLNRHDEEWTMPISALTPNNYHAVIQVEDTTCQNTITLPIDFTKQFPAEQAFKYLFNNVLALYNADNNGGYEFVAFQWYVHHSGEPEGFFMPIPGATNWMYTIDSTFTVGDQFYVSLTQDNGTTINTCPYEIKTIDYAPGRNNAPAASKQIENGQLRIRREDTTYTIFGVRVR